jgi:Ca2+-binding RTX toxin-like protein
MKRFYSLKVKLIILLAVVSVTLSFSIKQTSWAELINCPSTVNLCNGTSADDIIFGNQGFNGQIIQGLGGNDWIQAASNTLAIVGGEGNDTLLGNFGNDQINGGPGSDKMDGGPGDDVIQDFVNTETVLVNNNDIISGGEGNDNIQAGVGADRIHGGPGNDVIFPDFGLGRDFSVDIVNCGADTQDRIFFFHSADGDTNVNCEFVTDVDR